MTSIWKKNSKLYFSLIMKDVNKHIHFFERVTFENSLCSIKCFNKKTKLRKSQIIKITNDKFEYVIF